MSTEADIKRFRIPNRDVRLTEEESAVTRTRVFQRLFHLKQLGLAYLVYPCATHTRAGHSIECLDEASKLLTSIGVGNRDPDWATVRMAALLHDIGHVPFGHTLEDENLVLPKHDKEDRLQRVLELLKSELRRNKESETVLGLIEKAGPVLAAISEDDESKHDWRSDLVGNTVCADLLAYITTDAAWTGIEKRPGYYRIYDYFEVSDRTVSTKTNVKRLCIKLTKGGLRPDIVSAILDLLDMRYALTERVLFHHAKAIGSAMLARAARLCGLKERKDEPWLLEVGDEGLLNRMEAMARDCQDANAGKGAELLMEHLRSRRLYKRIFKAQRGPMEGWDRQNATSDDDTFCNRWRDGDRVEELLCGIEDRHDLTRGSLVLWCPKNESGMKLVNVNVIWEHSQGWHKPEMLRSDAVRRQFSVVHDRVKTIEKQYLDLWSLWIGIHPDHMSKGPAVVEDLSTGLEIQNDSVFVDTYVKKRSKIFLDSSKLHDDAKAVWQEELMPDVDRKLQEHAAYPEGKDRKGQVGAAEIIDAIHDVSGEKSGVSKKRRRSKPPQQVELPGTPDKEEGPQT